MVDVILGLLGTILYPMFGIIFLLINAFQGIFGAFAGIDNVSFGRLGSGAWDNITSNPADPDAVLGETNGGLVYYLLNSALVKNIFFSILTLAVFLLVIFTVMAFIKNVYTAKPKRWQDIISSTVKGLMNFIFVPVCCLLGVWLSNILLQAINGATSVSGATDLSRQLFVASAYSANKIRQQDKITVAQSSEIVTLAGKYKVKINVSALQEDSTDRDTIEIYADIVDQVYGATNGQDIVWWWNVDDYYHLYEINYILLAGGGIFIIWAMINISYGMVKRLFMLLFLFVISPGMCAMYPLDDGSAVGKWKGDFIKNLLSAYGAVVGMNLFFSLVPIVQNIKFVGAGATLSYGIFGGLIPLLLTIAGLYVVKDLISLFSGYIGASDALSDGKSLRGNVKDRIKKTGAKVGAFTRGLTDLSVSTHQSRKDAKNDGKGFWGQFGAGAKTFFTGAGKSALDLSLEKTADALGMKDTIYKSWDENIVTHAKGTKDTEKEKSTTFSTMKESFDALRKALSDKADAELRGDTTAAKKQDDKIEALMKEIKNYGGYGKAVKAVGYDLEALESNKKLTDGVKDAAKTFKDAAEALQKWKDENRAKDASGINGGKLHAATEYAGKTAQEIAQMEKEDEAIRTYRSLVKTFDDAKKGLDKAGKSVALSGDDKITTGFTAKGENLQTTLNVDVSTMDASTLSGYITSVENAVNGVKDAMKTSEKAVVDELAANSEKYEKITKKSDKK